MAATPSQSFGAYLGRNQGPELFYSLNAPFTIGGSLNVIPALLNLQRPQVSINVQVKFRSVIATANYSAMAAEGLPNIINRVKVWGTFKGAALTPIDMSGATLWTWPLLFGLRGSSIYINGTRQLNPTSPYQLLAATYGNTGTYDVEINYIIPMAPLTALSTRAAGQVPFFWQPQDWNNSLQIQFNVGDQTSFGTLGGSTTNTFTAFGVGTGNPTVTTFQVYTLLGTLRNAFQTACVVRNEQSNPSLTALNNNTRVMTLSPQKTTNIVMKTGLLLAGTSSGVQVYASLSDVIADVTQVQVDNRALRLNQNNPAFKEHMGLQFSSNLPQGYFNTSFIDSQNPRSALRADLPTVVSPGAQFYLTSNIISGNAANYFNTTQEQIYAGPNDPAWLGTR